MRKKKKDEEQSMDSMMDTLTNVIGILMFVLMITMLSVNDAVKQIVRKEAGVEAKDITPAQIEQTRQQARQLEQKVKELKVQEPQIKTAMTTERTTLLELQNTVTREQTIQVTQTQVDPKELQKQVEQKKQQIEQMRKQVQTTTEQVETRKNELAQTPEYEEKPAKIVRLPDPREAPKGAQQELFFCRGGRVMYVNVDGLQSLAVKLSQQFAKPVNGEINCEQLIKAFSQRAVGNEDFKMTIQVQNAHPMVILERKPEAGETLEEMEKENSDFQRKIRTINTRLQYCRFVVWPDSFEAYLKARDIIDERGLLAGWQPTTFAGEWPLYVPGLSNFKCKGHMPPPPPPPSAASGSPGPPKPADIID